jgi:hypothetical protein
VPSRSQEVSRISPAPRLVASTRPGDGVLARALLARAHDDLPAAALQAGRGVQREHHTLPPKTFGELGEERRAAHGGGVGRDLVGPGLQEPAGVLDLTHAAADGERDAQHRAHGLDGAERRRPALVRGGDVEDHQLIGALGLVARGLLHGISGVAEALKAHTLHDAAITHV